MYDFQKLAVLLGFLLLVVAVSAVSKQKLIITTNIIINSKNSVTHKPQTNYSGP